MSGTSMVPAPRPSLPSGYPNSSPRRYHHHYSGTDFDRDTENPSRMETYYGHVRTPLDAIILFEACRLGLLPRVQRRLSEKERQAIRSGSVFVWDEREAGMRRWTDGKSWSASRVSGSFLTYREMEGKRGGLSSRNGKSPDSKGSDEDREGQDDGLDGYRYKPDGLMKQSFSITTSTGQHLHLISYYSRSHPATSNLQQPSTDPALRHIQPQKGLYPESTINDQQSMPPVTRGPMASAAYHLPPHVAPFPPNGVTHPSSYPTVYGWTLTPLTTPPAVTIPYPGPGYAQIYPSPYGPPPSLPVPPPAHHHALPAPPPVNTSAAAIAASQVESRRPSMASLTPDSQSQSSPQRSNSSPTDSRPSLTPHTPRMSQLPPPTTAQDAPSSTTSTTVPSIGSLVNGSSQQTTSPVSASPNGVPPAKGPRDIPSEKLPIGGEDVRALQKLNSVFTA